MNLSNIRYHGAGMMERPNHPPWKDTHNTMDSTVLCQNGSLGIRVKITNSNAEFSCKDTK